MAGRRTAKPKPGSSPAHTPVAKKEASLESIVAGAIIDLQAHVALAEDTIRVGGMASDGQFKDVVRRWAEARGLSLARPAVEHWQDVLAASKEKRA